MITIINAIQSLRPGALFSVNGGGYEGLTWFDDNDLPAPTILEVEAKIVELRAAEPLRLLRVERDRLIAETDWWVLPDRTPTSGQLAYRQALRDLPSTATPVLDSTTRLGISGVTWPVKP